MTGCSFLFNGDKQGVWSQSVLMLWHIWKWPDVAPMPAHFRTAPVMHLSGLKGQLIGQLIHIDNIVPAQILYCHNDWVPVMYFVKVSLISSLSTQFLYLSRLVWFCAYIHLTKVEDRGCRHRCCCLFKATISSIFPHTTEAMIRL